ncbi:MAG: 3-isopropylmalate dehydratase small subunit [bacterium]
MQPFTTITGTAAVLDRANVDTDAIIPKQFLKRVPRTGYGPFLFYDWKYTTETICKIDEEKCDYILTKEVLDPVFELNKPQFHNASILLAGNNFGCGSSREHAVWALVQFGFKAIIAPKVGDIPAFADIFRNNSYKNGLLTIELSEEEVKEMMNAVYQDHKLPITINLENQTVIAADKSYSFTIDQSNKEKLLNGLDDISITMQYENEISSYEKAI